MIKNELQNFQGRYLKENFVGLCRLILKYPTRFMTNLGRWRHCLLIGDGDIPEEMKIYKEKTDRKTVKGTKKLLGVMKAKKILLYTPFIKWYLQHGLRLIAVHQLVEYEQDKPFLWFPVEVAKARLRLIKIP